MQLHIFASQEERRDYGGSCFVEIQFCRLPDDTAIEEIVAVSSIKHWQNDSLYVDDESGFYREYGSILDCGIYNNLKNGPVDVYGINYYPPSAINSLIERINAEAPADYELFAAWLIKAKQYNGFYILGV